MQEVTIRKGSVLLAVVAAMIVAMAICLPANAWAADDDLAIGTLADKASNSAADPDADAETPASAAFVKNKAKLDVDKSQGWLVEKGTYYFALATDASKVIGSKGAIQAKTGAKNQQWKIAFDYNSQCYTITNAKTGKVLSVSAKAKKGSKLKESKLVKKKQRLTKLSTIPSFNIPIPSQRWKLKSNKNGYYLVSAANEDLVVDLSGAKAKLAKKKSKNSYFWFVGVDGTYAENGIGNGTYTVKSQAKKSFLNITKSKVTKNALAGVGAAKTLWGEMFDFEYLRNGYYKIVNYNSGMVLTAKNAKKVYQTKYGSTDKKYQLWKPVIVGENGAVQLINKGNGKALTVKGNTTKLTLAEPAADDAKQKWLINPTTTGLTTVGKEALHRANKKTSETKYAIVIDMTAHEYFLFRKASASQDGAPWVLDDTCRCSTGKPGARTSTASNGTLGGRADPPKGRVEGVPALYCYWAGGSGYLHSIVTYGPQGENQLGWNISLGCIRLPYDHAKYIYDMKISGTRMVRYYV